MAGTGEGARGGWRMQMTSSGPGCRCPLQCSPTPKPTIARRPPNETSPSPTTCWPRHHLHGASCHCSTAAEHRHLRAWFARTAFEPPRAWPLGPAALGAALKVASPVCGAHARVRPRSDWVMHGFQRLTTAQTGMPKASNPVEASVSLVYANCCPPPPLATPFAASLCPQTVPTEML